MGFVTFLDAVESFLRAELENVRRYDVPWRRRLWLYRNGFLSSKDPIWDLSRDTVDQYLSDVQYRETKRIAEPYADGLKNRVLFRLVVSRTAPHLLPDVYGLVRAGTFVDSGPFGGLESIDDLLDVLDEERVVVKPVTAANGDGIRILDARDGELRMNGRRVGRAELAEALGEDRDLLLVEHVEEASYASDIYPDSTNSLRIFTMVDPETGEPFVATATHRFGTRASEHIDNWSTGGISAGVDIDTGELRSAVVPPEDGSSRATWMETHPDTDAPIAGVSIPGWESVLDEVLELAGEYGWMWPQVGWDVVVRDDQGTITVLEGERVSIDTDQQAHGPLLADERVRRFYEHHGVLRDR